MLTAAHWLNLAPPARQEQCQYVEPGKRSNGGYLKIP